MKISMQMVARCCVGGAVVCGFAVYACRLADAQQRGGASSAPARMAVPFKEPEPLDFNDHAGFTQIFDGKTLKGWEGDPTAWRVENGAIVGESFKDKPRPNSYIAYHGAGGTDGEAKDFDLKLEIKVENGGGSGIQYRSVTGKPWIRGFAPGVVTPNLNWMMTGPQADFWYPVNPQHNSYTGQFYSENTPLGILAYRGQVVEQEPGKEKQLVGTIGDRSALGGYVKINDWNQYEIIARGGVFLHILNGQLMAVYLDDDPTSSNNGTGLIGIELEGQPSKVSVREVWLRRLK
ncbi:3-keto-disaccharide hydrolase [Granulicella paludicola]|uniref:3-keto-disaccharide hydrolase n=1 Tax=Granulicella paludicola TaxID=474951 RepID=UPI0021E0F94E|nr:DUF1080 domain-containing protein [Granulicella paludicola]